jgi:hypothetical protein
MSEGLEPDVIRRIEAFLTVQQTGTLELGCKDGKIVEVRIIAATLWHAPRKAPEPVTSNGRGA